MYCTQTDIKVLLSEATLRQLTDDASEGVVDTTKVTAAIAAADEVIDGYLRGRYTVPLTTVPGLILGVSRDLSIYELFSKRGEGGVPEVWETRKKDAVQKLLHLQKGILVLEVTSPDARQSTPIVTNKTATDRLFSKTLLEGF